MTLPVVISTKPINLYPSVGKSRLLTLKTYPLRYIQTHQLRFKKESRYDILVAGSSWSAFNRIKFFHQVDLVSQSLSKNISEKVD